MYKFFVAAVLLLIAVPAYATAPVSEIHITADGKFSAKNIVVMQKSDTTLFSRANWNNAFIRLTVLTNQQGSTTQITKNNGGAGAVADIQEGDILNIEGTLSPVSDTLQVIATKIKDLNLNKEDKILSGTVKSVDYTAGSLTLTSKTLGVVTVVVDGSKVNLQKGVRTVSLGEVVVGDKVLSVSGSYDYTAKTLAANAMELYQDKSVFLPKNFDGTIKEILSGALTVIVGKQDYTVFLSAGTTITNKNKVPVDLSRFAVGDKVRLYGSIRQVNLQQIDASAIRNLNF